MKKALLIIYAGKETHEGMGRVANALVMASELKEAGHTVEIIFDGAGTEWIPELENKENKLNSLYIKAKGNVSGICEHCAGAFDVREKMPSDAKLLGSYEGHPSMKKYIEEDYEIITF